MKRNNCFYCQASTGRSFAGEGKCGFCGVNNNPLYLVNYQGKPWHFCCGCAWWQFPHSQAERKAEDKWYQKNYAT